MNTSGKLMKNNDASGAPARVLLLAESPYFGGISSHILSIARAARFMPGFEIVVATLAGKGSDVFLVDTARATGVPVHVLPMSWTFDVRVVRSLRRFMCENQIDLVHTHNYRATIVAALAAGSTSVVTTCHGMKVAPTLRLRLWQWAELRAMRRLPVTIACSDFVRHWLVRQGIPQDRVRTIGNGFEPPEVTDSGPTRDSLGISKDATVVAYVGRLAPGKGVELLLDALKGAQNSVCVLVGDGPLRSSLKAQATRLGVAARFVGYVANPGPLHQLADVVALPSEMEALPMSLIEAAAYGKPAVATRVGGIPEVVEDGVTGLLVAPANVAALRDAIARLADPRLRETMGRAALDRWRARFSCERMADDLSRAYRDALDAASRHG